MNRMIYLIILFILVMSSGCSPDKPRDNVPQIAILSTHSIEIIDLSHYKLKSVKLRSLASDFAYNKKNGLIYTAQCGGCGKDADNVIGEIDADRGKVTKYIELDYPNPNTIIYYQNKLYIIHGFLLKTGLFVGSSINPENNYDIKQFFIPGIPNKINQHKDSIFSVVSNKKLTEEFLIDYNLVTNTYEQIDLGTNSLLTSITFDNQGNGYGLLYQRLEGITRPLHGYQIVVFEPETSKLIKKIDLSELRSLEGTPNDIIWSNNKLFVSVYNWGIMKGNTIAIINPDTGQIEHLLNDLEQPNSMLIHNNKLYVGEYIKRLSIIDLNTYEIVKQIPLKGCPYKMLILP